jgi:hypothetical protein
MKADIKKGDWVLCPLTSDDNDEPTIVAKVDSVEEFSVNIIVANGTVPISKKYCRVVHVQVSGFKF